MNNPYIALVVFVILLATYVSIKLKKTSLAPEVKANIIIVGKIIGGIIAIAILFILGKAVFGNFNSGSTYETWVKPTAWIVVLLIIVGLIYAATKSSAVKNTGKALGGILKFAAIVAILWVAVYYFPAERLRNLFAEKSVSQICVGLAVVRPLEITPISVKGGMGYIYHPPHRVIVRYRNKEGNFIQIRYLDVNTGIKSNWCYGYVDGPNVKVRVDDYSEVPVSITFEPADSVDGEFSFEVWEKDNNS